MFDMRRHDFVKYTKRAEVAQLVEQRTENPRVASSILALGTISFSPISPCLLDEMPVNTGFSVEAYSC